jgi:transcriptional regulator with PAS, ATPase and Fis domain
LEDPLQLAVAPFGMLGQSPTLRRALHLAAKVAPTDSTVLITGETGTGKELLARAIHGLSPRRDQPFVAVNTGAIPETLQEAELFGHSKGSFTGADRDRKGLFEEANKGTLFLDEVGEMSPSLQVKLLRALESREVRAVGSTEGRRVDVRVLAATHRDLAAMVRQGRFREDLYFRLNVIQIPLPPLRARGDDLRLLLESFLERHARRYGKPGLRYAPETLELLLRHAWPGNVRELDNVVQHGVLMADGPKVLPRDLPPTLEGLPRLPAPGGGALPRPAGSPLVVEAPGFLTLEEVERRHIMETLQRCRGNQSLAARRLGISRSTLWRKMKELALDDGGPGDTEEAG